MRHFKKRVLALLLAGAVGIGNYASVSASAIKDAQDKKDEAQQELNQVNQQIQNIQSAQNSLQAEMNNYDNQLMSLLTDMDILQSDMDTQEQEIEQANADLENAKAEEQQQYDAMKQRIQYMYENGDQSFLTALVGADSITDLLNRVEYVSDVYQYDRDMLTNYQEVVQQVEDLTAQLESEMAEMEELQISYQEQQSSLEQVIATKRSEMADFDSQLAKERDPHRDVVNFQSSLLCPIDQPVNNNHRCNYRKDHIPVTGRPFADIHNAHRQRRHLDIKVGKHINKNRNNIQKHNRNNTDNRADQNNRIDRRLTDRRL